MFSFHPNAGFGSEVLAFELFGGQGVDEGRIKFGPLDLDVEMVANAVNAHFNRGWFDDDFFHLGKTALCITCQGIAPSTETAQSKSQQYVEKQPSFPHQRHVRCPFSVVQTKPFDKWVSSVLLCGTPPREV
jgi:hypothetical protein